MVQVPSSLGDTDTSNLIKCDSSFEHVKMFEQMCRNEEPRVPEIGHIRTRLRVFPLKCSHQLCTKIMFRFGCFHAK